MTTTKDAGGPVKPDRRRRLDLTTPTLLSLPLAWLVVFFVVPIVFVGGYSVGALSLSRAHTTCRSQRGTTSFTAPCT